MPPSRQTFSAGKSRGVAAHVLFVMRGDGHADLSISLEDLMTE